MGKECPHCHALKFKRESAGICCASGKVQLPEIETPPEPLNGLLIGTDPDSNLFLKSIRTFNSCFQMTSFGATEIVHNTAASGQQYNSTFKMKGQVYHKLGSLLPMPNEPHKFLLIYFMGTHLGTPCFSHGQLYVACSRVGKPSSLFVLAKDGLPKTIVHLIALQN
ncbi:uncharacterized protein LOC107264866 [Cephus cinctus]|uniref:Uncharacterized protein LOC107264866 n=1 Tax=Cephus cinctus TaxID=211228 RepID=A0AAJ7FFE4_CEPCN|nr:uncharacterized protein LOC107264866 [Cephus cinctus]